MVKWSSGARTWPATAGVAAGATAGIGPGSAVMGSVG